MNIFFLHGSASNVILAFSGSAEIEIRDFCVYGAGELVHGLETATGLQLNRFNWPETTL